MAKKKPIYRIKFTLDDQDAQFEECNGESRPLTETEYAENQYMGCPDHPRGYKGSKGKDTSDNGRGTCACGKAYAPIPYAEYLAYYGNPDRHVYLGCVAQRACPCCGNFTTVASLWHIAFMNDDRAYNGIDVDVWYAEELAATLPDYAGEVAREMLSEAKHAKA